MVLVLSQVLLINTISGKHLKLRKTKTVPTALQNQGSHLPSPRTIIHTTLVLGTKCYYFLKLMGGRGFSGLFSGRSKIQKETPGWPWNVLRLRRILQRPNKALAVDVNRRAKLNYKAGPSQTWICNTVPSWSPKPPDNCSNQLHLMCWMVCL